MPSQSLPIDRRALGEVFKDPRTLVAVERALQLALQVSPNQIAALQALLDAAQMVISTPDPDFPAARVLTGSTGVTIDTATAGLIKVLVNVATALGYTPAHQTDVAAIQAAPVVTTAPTGAFSGEEVLAGSTGLTIDLSVPGVAKLVLNVLTALNAAAINLTQPVVNTASLEAASVKAVGALECGSLRIDDVATATATLSDHSVPILIGATLYYMRLSTAP